MTTDTTSAGSSRSEPRARRKVYRVLFVVLVFGLPLLLGLVGALSGPESSGDGDMEGAGTIIFALAGFVLWAVGVLVAEFALWIRRATSSAH